jgi:hypothetical protein
LGVKSKDGEPYNSFPFLEFFRRLIEKLLHFVFVCLSDLLAVSSKAIKTGLIALILRRNQKEGRQYEFHDVEWVKKVSMKLHFLNLRNLVCQVFEYSLRIFRLGLAAQATVLCLTNTHFNPIDLMKVSC